jgi:hypothetical protein
MAIDVVLHLGLEATGAGILACVTGTCKHNNHTVLKWLRWPIIATIWVGMSILTVWMVG